MMRDQMSKNKMNNKIVATIKINKLKTIMKMKSKVNNSKVNNNKDHMMNLTMSIFHHQNNRNKVSKIKSKMLILNNKEAKVQKMRNRMNKNKVLMNKVLMNKIKIPINNNHKSCHYHKKILIIASKLSN